MAYETFIPTVWNANLMRELEGKYVLAKHTYRAFEGQVAEQGDSVRFFGVGRPTIHETTVPTGKRTLHRSLPDPEEIENTTITMPIQQIRHYNYTVGDIDKLQMKWDGRVISAYQQETADELASSVDKYLGQTVFPKAPVFSNSFAVASTKIITVTAGDSDATADTKKQNALELLDDIVQKARENNISDTTKLYVAVSPKIEKIMRQRLISISTDNVVLIEGKEYLKYYNLYIEWSNNLYSDTDYELLTVRTDRAVGFAHPHTHVEPYRPEKGFADAIKGFILFDAMILRPKEIFIAKVTV